MIAAKEHPLLRVSLAGPLAPRVEVAVSVLHGAAEENVFGPVEPAGVHGDFALYRTDHWLLGAASVRIAGDLEHATRALYAELLSAARGHSLARIWNYVPAINETGSGGMENYRAFCRGRSLAFEQQFGASFSRQAPAASAVGCDGATLTAIFAATGHPVRHVENPQQVPAYVYPPEHGPRPPTFARASIVNHPAGEVIFVSGTAAIRGHRSVAPHQTREQLTCTLENLQAISRACGMDDLLSAGETGAQRHFKVYLRHGDDLAVVAPQLDAHLLRPDDTVTYLHSSICRAELNVEIEATIRRPRSGRSAGPHSPANP